MTKTFQKTVYGTRKYRLPRRRKCIGCKFVYSNNFSRHARSCSRFTAWKQEQKDGTWVLLSSKFGRSRGLSCTLHAAQDTLLDGTCQHLTLSFVQNSNQTRAEAPMGNA